MGDAQIERRLAAILAADVVGYSRLMGADEAGTLAALKEHRRELVDGKIGEHQGRIVKLTDDGKRRCVYSLLGEADRSIEILESYLSEVGNDMKLWFKRDSDVNPIRSHPRYQKLLELIGQELEPHGT